MPVRATKRGAERTPLSGVPGRPDLRRELRRPGGRARACAAAARACSCSTATRSASARRRACAAPTEWLAQPRARGVDPPDVRRRSSSTRPRADVPLARCRGRSRRSTTAQLCALLCAQRRRASSRRRRSTGAPASPSTPTAATSRAPLIVDALGWRRVLSRAERDVQPPEARAVARPGGPPARRRRRPRAVDRPALRRARATAGASRPATSCASASARSTRATTSRSRRCASPRDVDVPAVRYQGNWIPHQHAPGRSRTASSSPATPPATACR